MLTAAQGGDRSTVMRARARACRFQVNAQCNVLANEIRDEADTNLVVAELQPACKASNNLACLVTAIAYTRGTAANKRTGLDMLANLCATSRYEEACVRQARMVYAGEAGNQADRERGEQLFRRACDDNMGAACLQLAIVLERDKHDPASGLRYAELACTRGFADGCTEAGFILYTAPKGVSWDIKKAAEFYGRGCELNGAIACSNAAELFRYGIIDRADAKRAFELYKKSCTLGSMPGCAGEAHYLGSGEGGTTKDAKRAIELDRTACEDEYTSSEACVELAPRLRAEHGSPSEKARLQQRGFDLTRKSAETNPGYMYWMGTFYRDGMSTMRDPAKAREWFVKSCDGFDPLGCITAARILATSSVPADRERARVYFQRACGAGMDDACKGEQEVTKGQPSGPGPAPGRVDTKKKGCGGCESSEGGLGGMLVIAVALLIRRRRG
jgi:TPR repeat protein